MNLGTTDMEQQTLSQQPGLGYDILRSCVLFTRTKCRPLFMCVTFAIFPFMSLVYNVINLTILFTFIWYPDFLVNVLYVTFVPIFSLMSAVFDKYLKALWWLMYRNILDPIMPLIISVAGYVLQIIVNVILTAVEHLGYNGVLRVVIFVFILLLLQFFNVLVYISIQLPTELLKILFG